MFYMLKLITDGPQHNVSINIAINFHEKVTPSDAENGVLLDNSQTAYLKDPQEKTLYWSIGLIINHQNRTNGKVRQNITVKVLSTAITCRYWNNTSGSWSSGGFKVSPVSSSNKLECEVDHLTDFAGGYFVLPNIVDPIQDALLFLTFFDNPVVVSVVILVWLLYFVGLFLARQKDRRDRHLDGIVTPCSSDPSEPFKYLMCIVTGWRYDARTTANVSCYIKGKHGHTARHCLTRSSSPQVLFTTGAEDWFLITSSYDIGDVVNVIIWHDNSGSSPSWFLSRILIQDLQTKKVYTFYHDKWLGMQSGTAKVCLSIESNYDLKQQFLMRTTTDLRRAHLWISIVSKPPWSDFTRVQRLSCALSLLLCTMLSCIMFHGIPTESTTSSDVAGIRFEFSLKDFVIGIESSLIMFPINFVIIKMFLISKTKQQHREGYMEIDVTSPESCDKKGSGKREYTIVAVKRSMCPRWGIYIAWTTTILTSLISSYFVMLYGLQYGYYESLNWLVSFLTAFVDDCFVMEPTSVVFFALLFTYLLKRRNITYYRPALIVREFEDNNSYWPKKSKKWTFIPEQASRKHLRKAKQEFDFKKKVHTNLQDIIIYVIFTFMLLFVVHNQRPVEKCFQQSQVINSIFIKKKIENVKTRGDIWTYIKENVIPPLSKTIQYETSRKIPENDFLLLGKFRLRQIRVPRDSCKFPDKLKKLFGFDHLGIECSSSMNSIHDDNIHYNKSWQIQSQGVSSSDEWSYQNAWDLDSVPYIGDRAIYSGGGYLVDMKAGSSAISKISELNLKSWIDIRTRAFFIEFVLYNPNVNMYSSVMIAFEYSSPGTLTKSFQIYTSPLSDYSSSEEVTRLVFELVNHCYYRNAESENNFQFHNNYDVFVYIMRLLKWLEKEIPGPPEG
ncbi:PKD1L2 [Mytilus coruscus]|uniref:PKD1L2 n=1 Tax=Mytilus coruscus TaxID=42192 RepID=A0A6J8ENC9_MYTCO|nr:PKD1L2 [Mytilus coruscus]